MLPIYEETEDALCVFDKESVHVPPHLHKSVECVFVTEGSLALGIGQELYHMNKGDFAMVFPELIHHYQVFEPGSRAVYVLVTPSFGGSFLPKLQRYCPRQPVIRKEELHKDIPYAMYALADGGNREKDMIIMQAFFQIILARSMAFFELEEKASAGSVDIIYRTVNYIAVHFRESVSLSKMAHDLGTNRYTLSRVFSKTFHRNFNQYLNEVRLDYACALLEYTEQSIIDVCMNSGFESQRTFNRVFQERYHKTPREYRKCI